MMLEVKSSYIASDVELAIEMTPQTFEQFLSSKSNGMINFYQSWCGHCIRLAHDWDRLGKEVSSNNVMIGKINCGDHDAFCKEKGVHQWPMVLYYVNGKEHIYSDSLAYDDMSLFVLENISPRCGFDSISNCSDKAALFALKWKQKSNSEILNEIDRLESLLSEADDLKLELKRWIRERIIILRSHNYNDHVRDQDEM